MRNNQNRAVESFTIDILLCIQKLNAYAASFNGYDSFLADKLDKFDGAMRNLEIIGEALKYILSHEPFEAIINPRWRMIVSFRNVIVHHYFGIDMDEIYSVFTEKLPVFEAEFLDFVDKIKKTSEFKLAVQDALLEQQQLKHTRFIKYLESLAR